MHARLVQALAQGQWAYLLTGCGGLPAPRREALVSPQGARARHLVLLSPQMKDELASTRMAGQMEESQREQMVEEWTQYAATATSQPLLRSHRNSRPRHRHPLAQDRQLLRCEHCYRPCLMLHQKCFLPPF